MVSASWRRFIVFRCFRSGGGTPRGFARFLVFWRKGLCVFDVDGGQDVNENVNGDVGFVVFSDVFTEGFCAFSGVFGWAGEV